MEAVRSAKPSLPGSSSAAPTWKTRRRVTRGLDGEGKRTMRIGDAPLPPSAWAEGAAEETAMESSMGKNLRKEIASYDRGRRPGLIPPRAPARRRFGFVP